MSKEVQSKYVERDILLAMIVSTEFMTYVKDPLALAFKLYQKGEFIQSKEIEMVMRWVLHYFEQYGRAPYKNMQGYFESRAQRMRRQDSNEYDLVSALVDSLSQEWEEIGEQEINAAAKWDIAKEYFNLRRAAILSKELEWGVDNFDIESIEDAVSRFSKTESSTSRIVDLLTDEGLTQRAHEQRAAPLIQLPGAIGQMMNPHMVPTAFVSFLGSEKRGKTWWLLYMYMMAARNRIPTIMFQGGDMSEEDVDMRTGVHIARRSNDMRYCGAGYTPILDCAKNQRGECTGPGLVYPNPPKNKGGEKKSHSSKKEGTEEDNSPIKSLKDVRLLLSLNPEYEPCTECMRNKQHAEEYEGAVYWKEREKVQPLTIAEHKEAKKNFIERFKLTDKNAPKLVRYSAGELTVAEIKSVLERLKTHDFVPRIVIVDYMDLLCTDRFSNDFRNSQFEIWKSMRGLAQSANCLVVTATQANGASYNAQLLDESNFSEDKRKNGLVTALFGLNQSPKEKELGIMRINTILAREGYFDKRKTVSVLQCLQMGQPVLGSFDS